MSPVIRSASRLSRRLDLCNAARAESPDRRHARGHFAIDEWTRNRAPNSDFCTRHGAFSNSSLFPFFIALPMALLTGRIIEGYPLPRGRFR